MRWIIKALRAMLVLYLIAAGAVVAFSKLARGSRSDQIRRFNRKTLNPRVMKYAGRKHWYVSAVGHTGRASGRKYETPVLMHEVDGHIAIPLPYGRDVDWLENLQHAGGGVAVHKGLEYRLADPVIVSRDAIAHMLGPRDTLRYRAFGVDDFVKLRAERVSVESPMAV